MACLWTDKEDYKGWLISAIRIASGGIDYMDEKMIRQIVSDCGYQALGLYSYLFSARNIIDVTEISIEEIAHAGDYFDYSELIEDIKLLAEFGYLLSDGNVYFFPKSIDYMNTLQEFQKYREDTDN